MRVLVCGVRHHQVSIEDRERFALCAESVQQAFDVLRQDPAIAEIAIVSTCNRTELYLAASNPADALQAVRQFFIQHRGIAEACVQRCLFTYLYEDVVFHLFRVASGLDSLIIGEGQILAQVKDALELAQKTQVIGPVLDKLFKSALSVGKRVRTETPIAQRDVSVSKAAYDAARQVCPDFDAAPVALIGGGKVAAILLRHLHHQANHSPSQDVALRSPVMIVNRSEARLAELHAQYPQCEAFGWDALPEVIARAQVLFVATGAPHYVMTPEHFAAVTADKWVFDLAVPRNVDPQCGELAQVTLWNTDDLKALHPQMPHDTHAAIVAAAEHIVVEEATLFGQWLRSREATATITGLRSKIEAIRQTHLQTFQSAPPETRDTLEALSKQLVNKILHDPIARLRQAPSSEHMAQQTQVLSDLFGLQQRSVQQGKRVGSAYRPVVAVPSPPAVSM